MRLIRVGALLAIVALGASAASAAEALTGDPARGQAVYERCEGCHSLDANRVGPMHRGVFGRKAGAVEGYAYSMAVKKSDIVWNETTLDQWLSGPGKLIPGTKMGFKLNDAQARADVIAYLKRESGE
jgi:cytochrome c